MKFAFVPILLLPFIAIGQDSPPRCEIIPEPSHGFSFRIDGVEITKWHAGADYPRPFFYPLNGPSGKMLTRMGHPGAPNHDHHQSVWFAHHDVEGHSFWANSGKGVIRQKDWLAIEDGDDEAVLAVLLGWFDPEGNELLEQETITAIRPLPENEYELEIQLTLEAPKGRESTELAKTNFGLLSVRVAKSISAHFGGGVLTNSEEEVGEENIFGKRAKWMDYSGPVAVGTGMNRKWVREGITFFDHPENPRFPTHWHVRNDGWMGASFCFAEGIAITKETPLKLRYLLHVHQGEIAPPIASKRLKAFAERQPLVLKESAENHRQYEARRNRE